MSIKLTPALTALSMIANEVRSSACLAYEASKMSGVVVPLAFDDYCKSLKSCLPSAVNDPKVDAVHTATD